MKSVILSLLLANTAALQRRHHHKHHKMINPYEYIHAKEDTHDMETLEAMSTEKLVGGLRNTLNLALEAEARDDKAAAVAKTAAIKNIQKALTARILKRLDDGQPLVEVARKMKAIEGMQPQINDMERRLGIMQSVEPVLENAIKTLQKVVDVRGMGKSLVQLDDPEFFMPFSQNQLLLDEFMASQGDGEGEAKKEGGEGGEAKKEGGEAGEAKKEEKKEGGEGGEAKKEEKKEGGEGGEAKKDDAPKKEKKKCEWTPPALEAENKKEKDGAAPPKEKAEAAAKEEEKKEEAKKDGGEGGEGEAGEGAKKEEKKKEGGEGGEAKKEEKKKEGGEGGEGEGGEGAKKAAAAPAPKEGEEDCIPLDEDEKKAAKKEYDSIRAAEKQERAAEKAELEHKNSTMEMIRSKAYWDHMNASKPLIQAMKDGILKSNQSAYENRGIEVQENEKKNKEAQAKQDADDLKELTKI